MSRAGVCALGELMRKPASCSLVTTTLWRETGKPNRLKTADPASDFQELRGTEKPVKASHGIQTANAGQWNTLKSRNSIK